MYVWGSRTNLNTMEHQADRHYMEGRFPETEGLYQAIADYDPRILWYMNHLSLPDAVGHESPLDSGPAPLRDWS